MVQLRNLKWSFILSCCMLLTSSMEAQELLVPYRVGNQWGLADTQLNIKVQPQFDSISRPYIRYDRYITPFYNYFTYKNGKMGFIRQDSITLSNQFGNLRLQFPFVVDYDTTRQVVGRMKRNSHYFSLKGAKIVNRPVGYHYYETLMRQAPRHYRFYAFHYNTGKRQLLLYNYRNLEVQLLGDTFDYYDIEYINPISKKLTLFLGDDLRQEIIFSLNSNNELEVTQNPMTKIPQETEDDEEYAIEEIEMEDEIYAVEEAIPDDAYFNGKYKGPIKECYSFRYDAKEKLELVYYLTRARSLREMQEISAKQEVINTYKLKRKHTQIRKYQGKTEFLLSLEYKKDKTAEMLNNYAVYSKKNKLGIINHLVFTQPLYESVEGYQAHDKTPVYIVSKMVDGQKKFLILNERALPLNEEQYLSAYPIFSRYSNTVIAYKVQKDNGNGWTFVSLFGKELLAQVARFMIDNKKMNGKYFCMAQKYHKNFSNINPQKIASLAG